MIAAFAGMTGHGGIDSTKQHIDLLNRIHQTRLATRIGRLRSRNQFS